MKKILILFLMIFLSVLSFSKGTVVKELRLGTGKMIFEIDGDMPERVLKYDDSGEMIFIEFSNTTAGSKIKNMDVNGNYLKKIETVSFDNNTDFFITIKKGVKFKEEYLENPTRLVLNFSTEEIKKHTIVIDPGHGGKDPGAVTSRSKEKDIVFLVAKELKEKLEPKYNVILTRDKDSFISLGERTKIADEVKADLFISIHANANKNANANGIEVFYYSKKADKYASEIAKFENSVDENFGIKEELTEIIVNDLFYRINMEKSKTIASLTESYLSKRTGMKDRGIFGAGFKVLRTSTCPAILIELGFITNKNDSWKLRNQKYQNSMAESIKTSINKYFN